jgi:UDP-N-acetylmuramate: L-alanyl-gamma-D-glutamyl-meso-diaminopimelate ligase
MSMIQCACDRTSGLPSARSCAIGLVTMNKNLNRITGTVKKIHLIAACGTGMGALGCILNDMGFTVTGSDDHIYPPMSRFLEKKQIPIQKGFHAHHISPDIDLVVIGNAVTRDNPEALQAQTLALNYCSMPQAINHFAARGKKPLVICGTHGKTTTASLLAWVLYCAGLDPSFIIGGILTNFTANYRIGQGDYIVIEGDEYDTAFFDKEAKFFHYSPHIAILTSVEFDHADIFDNLDHIKRTFKKYLATIGADNLIIAFDDDKNVSEVVETAKCALQSYGCNSDTVWRLGKTAFTDSWTQFEVLYKGNLYGRFKSPMMGKHNLMNTLAVIAASARLGITKDMLAQALKTFQGIKRRQEIRGCVHGITVMDDFAHHPTAVFETIAAVKSFHPHQRLIAVFEPRTNSSMRNIFQHTYPNAFVPADMVCIREPSRLDKIPAHLRFSSRQLVDDLISQGKPGYYFSDTEAIIAFLAETTHRGDIILIMSNGGFDNIHVRLLKRLAE